MTRIARIFTDRFGKRFYRKGREGRKEDPYRGFTQMHADLWELSKGNKTLPLMTLIARIFTDRAGNAFTAKDAKGAGKILTADLRGCTRIMGTIKREQNLTTDNTDDTGFH